MYYLHRFSKYAKYVGLASFIITFFNDSYIFKLLCIFGVFVFVEIAIEFTIFKCSILQIIGMSKANKEFGDNMPSVDNYKNKVDYSLPFSEKWVVLNGCYRKDYSHSWDIQTQRYAYDFIILDEYGNSYEGEFNQSESYYCYGKDILSPADGIVVEVVNSSDDSIILPKGKFFSRAKSIAGNYIVIKHAEQEYSTLAHLKKDSIMVKAGDTVSKGQVIAKCGNTGNSTEPHLHFQLQTGQSFYNSAGLPIQFSNIELSKSPNYEKIDQRQHMALEYVLDGYITRGFEVGNI